MICDGPCPEWERQSQLTKFFSNTPQEDCELLYHPNSAFAGLIKAVNGR